MSFSIDAAEGGWVARNDNHRKLAIKILNYYLKMTLNFTMEKNALAVSGVSTHSPANFALGGCGISFARAVYSRACERDAADRTQLCLSCE